MIGLSFGWDSVRTGCHAPSRSDAPQVAQALNGEMSSGIVRSDLNRSVVVDRDSAPIVIEGDASPSTRAKQSVECIGIDDGIERFELGR